MPNLVKLVPAEFIDKTHNEAILRVSVVEICNEVEMILNQHVFCKKPSKNSNAETKRRFFLSLMLYLRWKKIEEKS